MYFQQSWDDTKKTPINPKSKTITSIYQYPGFHIAKLFKVDRVVCEKPVVIPTMEWVGIVENGETPIYLDENDFMRDSLMSLGESKIRTFSINMETSPRLTQFYNVVNFDPVELTSLNFSTEIRHDFQKGASACQYTYILFYTNKGIVMIPISQKGCVAKLNLINYDHIIKGAENDLSGFGTDISRWTKVDVKNEREGILVYLNGERRYKIPANTVNSKVYGIGFFFVGNGSVKNLTIKNESSTVFKDLF